MVRQEIYQVSETNDDSPARNSTMPQRLGTSMRQGFGTGWASARPAIPSAPNTPRPIIAPDTPASGSTSFVATSPTVSRK